MKNKNHKKQDTTTSQKRGNSQQKKTGNPKAGLFRMLFSLIALKTNDEGIANRRAFHQVYMDGGNPIFHPRKHTVMGYAKQNRLAKQRRRSKV